MTALSSWFLQIATRFVPISLLVGLGIALWLMVSMLGKLSDIEQMLVTPTKTELIRSLDSEFGIVCYYTSSDIRCVPWYMGVAPWENPQSRPISMFPNTGGN